MKVVMDASDRKFLVFCLLAAESRERKQSQGELRFLLLTGSAACKAGCLKLAKRCYERIGELNPHHLLTKKSSFEDALKDEEFLFFLQRLDRFCTFEQAEMLVEKHHPKWETEAVDDPETYCLQLLETT